MPEQIAGQSVFQKKRLAANAVFSSFSWLVPIVLGFVATPMIVEGLGNEEYGLYSLILGFTAYSFAFGIGRAVTKYVSEFLAENRNEEVREIISITLWLSMLLGIAATVIVVSSSNVIVEDLLQIGAAQREKAVKALYLACATIIFLMVAQVFQAALQGIHRFDRLSIVSNAVGMVLIAGNVIAVKLNFGLNVLLGWNLFVTILNGLIFYLTVRKILPEFGLTFSVSKKNVNLVFSYGLGIVGYQISANLLLLFERIWITRKLGPESLTLYVVPMTLAVYFHGLVANVVLVIFPVFSELRNNQRQLIMLYQKASKYVLALSVLAVVTAFSCSQMFLTLWFDAEFAAQTYYLMNLHFVSFSILAVFTVIWQVADGFGAPRFNTLLSFVWLAVSVPLMLMLADVSGNYGVAVSRMTAVIVTIPFILIGEKFFLKTICWSFWAKIIFILTIAAALVFAFEKLFYGYFSPGWLILIGGTVAGAAIYAVLLWLLKFITAEEKFIFREMIKGKQN